MNKRPLYLEGVDTLRGTNQNPKIKSKKIKFFYGKFFILI